MSTTSTPNPVALSTVFQDFQQADKKGNGILDKQEIAQEALLLNNEGNTNEAQLFSTFVIGGTDGQGLFPDFFGTNGQPGTKGGVSLDDLAALAAADSSESTGDANSISAEDFKVKFGSRAGSGNTVDTTKLTQIAYPNGAPCDGSNSDSFGFLSQLFPFLSRFCRGGLGFGFPPIEQPFCPIPGNPFCDFGGGFGPSWESPQFGPCIPGNPFGSNDGYTSDFGY